MLDIKADENWSATCLTSFGACQCLLMFCAAFALRSEAAQTQPSRNETRDRKKG
jgi:hypothetical protein